MEVEIVEELGDNVLNELQKRMKGNPPRKQTSGI